MPFVEYVSYTVDDVAVSHFLQLRSAAITAVKKAHPGLLAVPVLSRQEDGKWTDVWIYEDQEAAEAANAGSGEVPEFMAFAELLGEVELVAGVMPEEASSPL